MTDLIARAKDYLKKTEGITEAEWEAQGYHDYSIVLNDHYAASEEDVDAINLTPTARRLIEELTKRCEELEQGLELSSPFSGDN